MAFAITNKRGMGAENPGLPVAHVETADQVGAVASSDLGVAGLKHIRGRVFVKAFGADNTHLSFVVKVSAAAAMTTPEVIYQSETYIAVSSNDAGINVDFQGWSEAGFRYVSLTPTTATGAITYDLLVDAA